MRRIAVLLLPLAFACIPNDAFVITNDLVTECTGDPPATLRVASYNVKSGAQTSLGEVGDVITGIAPDVLALQEVNVDFKGDDQVRTLAARLGYPYVYAAALSRGMSHTYGIALVSRFPLKRVERFDLWTGGAAEPRTVIDADVCVGGAPVRVLALHADVWQPGRNLEEVRTRLAPRVTEKTIVLGDFNVEPGQGAAETFEQNGLVDLIGKLAEGPTFWSSGQRLDYLYVDPWLAERSVGAVIGASKASDHHPIWADFALQ
jgi:endonuclease/exonuclease/phosphatase family metal-dependent hydrolase